VLGDCLYSNIVAYFSLLIHVLFVDHHRVSAAGQFREQCTGIHGGKVSPCFSSG
jgi:hypothetical protein